MSRMVDTLLLLARSDANQLRPRRTTLDVVDFLHEAVARWQSVAGRRDVRLDVDVPATGEAQADQELTRRALDNLVDNAIRYSAGPVVRLHAEHDGGGWRIRVMDTGAGVPEELRGRVFERFARADRARAHQAGGGTGLGLPLSRAFMRAQGGDLRLVDEPGWGAVFEMRLPD
jgi:signal transduction histidine kinase